MSKQRLDYLDYAKGILIILVVMGHCISYGCGTLYDSNEMQYSNFLYKLIFSFHMPAFSLISGYFMWGSTKKSLDNGHSVFKFVLMKTCRLIVPVAVWKILFYLVTQSISRSLTIPGIIYNFIVDFAFGLWFLWATLFASIILFFVSKFFKDRLWVYLIIIGLMLVVPDVVYTEFKFVFPFYLLGYEFARYKEVLFSMIKKHLVWFLIVNISLYVISMLFYKNDTYIYVSGYAIANSDFLYHLYNDVVRFVSGLTGSMLFIFVIYFIPSYEKIQFKSSKLALSFLSSVGKRTLGIYIVHTFLNFGLRYIFAAQDGFNFWMLLLQTIVICTISFFVVWILEKWKWTNRLLLGGK